MRTKVALLLAVSALSAPACSATDTTAGGGSGAGGSGAGGGFGATGGGGSGTGGSAGVTGGGTGGNAGVAGGGTGGQGGGTGGGGTGGSDGIGGAAGSGGTGGTGPEPPVVPGCGSTLLYQVPDDPSLLGPWPVGVRTVTVPIPGGTLTAEIWYPAPRGSEAGQANATYDLTHWLWNDASKIPPAENRIGQCDCFRDLPIDATHGPYPGVVFIHGLSSFRVASLKNMVHWASRGFVVIAADHWGSYLSDFVGCPGRPTGPAQNLDRDLDGLIAALTGRAGDLSFLGSAVDMSRVGVSGHSLGGQAADAASLKPNVRVVIPIAQLGGAGVRASTSIESALFLCGMTDSVNNYTTATKAGYNASTMKKRLVGITGGGHLDVTDLCVEKNNQGKAAIQVAQENGVCNALLLPIVAGLAQCGAMPDPSKGREITIYATTAALEETLHCRDRSQAFASMRTKYPEVGEFLEAL
jgi:predicted dienelactone hydrolase